jgi:3'-phosphoadenosine 5'-phosphosulfate (PAPS) 3'-phosphatase
MPRGNALFFNPVQGVVMTPGFRRLFYAIGAAGLFLTRTSQAQAACHVVSRTNDGFDKGSAVAASQGAFTNGLASYKRNRGWRRITSVTVYPVRPDPL